MAGHQARVKSEKPMRMRVISGSSALKPLNTLAKAGMTKMLMITRAMAIASIDEAGVAQCRLDLVLHELLELEVVEQLRKTSSSLPVVSPTRIMAT
jgi:hypothetical protein